MPTVDPNWLFSTAAQSAAAIVAIVGGFLATRIVSLSAERDSLKHRIRTLDAQLQKRQERLDTVRQGLLEWDAADFIQFHLDELVERRGRISLNDLIRLGGTSDRGSEELAPFYEEAVRTIQEAFRALEPDMRNKGWPPPDLEKYLAVLGLDAGDELVQTIYEAVYERIRSDLRARASPMHRFLDGPDLSGIVSSSSWAPLIESSAYQDRVQQERTLAMDVEQAAAEKQVYEDRLEDLGRPDPLVVWGGFGVLGYFALVGVAFPVWMLPRPTSSLDPAVRWTTTGLFLSGLLAVVLYFALAIRRVRGSSR